MFQWDVIHRNLIGGGFNQSFIFSIFSSEDKAPQKTNVKLG
jgi:hypothetical protein